MNSFKFIFIVFFVVIACNSNHDSRTNSNTLINCRQILRNHESSVKSIFKAVQWQDQKNLAIDSFCGDRNLKDLLKKIELNKAFIQKHQNFIDSFLSTNDLKKLYKYAKEVEQASTEYLKQNEYGYKTKSKAPDYSRHLMNGIDENKMLHFVKELNQFILHRFKDAQSGTLICSFNEDVVYNQDKCYKDQKYSFTILGTVLDVKVKSATCNGRPIEIKPECTKQQNYWVIFLKPKEFGEIDIVMEAKRFDFGMGLTTRPYFVTFKHINK